MGDRERDGLGKGECIVETKGRIEKGYEWGDVPR
jgi:hypothetical protein